MVIVKRDSQPPRLRVSRPDLGLADGSDWPVCGLAAAHKHTLWARCYFHPVCSPHPDLSHGQWCALGPRAAHSQCKALIQTGLTTNADLAGWPVVVQPRPGHRGNVQCLDSCWANYHYKVSIVTFNQCYCEPLTQLSHYDFCTQRALNVSMRQHPAWKGQEWVKKQLALCLALPFPSVALKSLSVLRYIVIGIVVPQMQTAGYHGVSWGNCTLLSGDRKNAISICVIWKLVCCCVVISQ